MEWVGVWGRIGLEIGCDGVWSGACDGLKKQKPVSF
jgi:hypothetical protein